MRWSAARGRAVLGLLAAGAGTALLVLTLTAIPRSSPFSPADATADGRLLLIVASGTALAAGVAVALQPGGTAVSSLVSCAAVAWCAAEWPDPTSTPPVFAAGLVVGAVGPAVVAHLAFVHPGGRAGSRGVRALLGVGYVVTLSLLGLAPAALSDSGSGGCFECPANPWVIVNRPEWAQRVERLGGLAALCWAAVTIVALVVRLVRMNPRRRRRSLGVTVSAGVFLLAAGRAFLSGATLPEAGPGVTGTEPWRLQAVALAACGAAILVDGVQERRARRALAALVVDLGRSVGEGGLRASLARQLGDPSLRVGYPVDGGMRYVDESGQEVDLTSAPEQSRTVLRSGNRVLAVLSHTEGLFTGSDEVSQLVDAVRLGLENERLQAESLAQLAELRASAIRVLDASDAERRQLERDLHDGAQQQLIGIGLLLALAAAESPRLRLAGAEAALRRATEQLRETAHGVCPPLLAEAGLDAAVRALAESADLDIGPFPAVRLPAVVETTVYLLIARLCAAGPTRVEAKLAEGRLDVVAELGSALPPMPGIADRVRTLDGTLDIRTTAAANQVTLRLPMA